ncbi:FAD-dependent oxidoreductase [Mesorhizobium sp. M0991]|uniref:FAD-dependent oxidoreductase n=1 Tax=Mesorhizobium sp. M0991 TaxID=2957043 RepID=UPI00333A9DD8
MREPRASWLHQPYLDRELARPRSRRNGQRDMTRRLLIIGGGILGMTSASAAAKAGGFSEIIVTEQALGPSGASHYSGGVHFPYGCQDRTTSLTRKSAVVLAAMAGSDVNGWYRPLAMRVVAGPGEAIDPAQFTEPLDPAEPDIGSLAPSFCGQYLPERNALSIAVPHDVSPSPWTRNLTSARLP